MKWVTIKFTNTPIKIDLQQVNSNLLNSSKIMFYDTTLRDGNQSVGINFSKNDKIKIAKKIDEVGIHYIEGGWPNKTNQVDTEFFREIKNEKIAAKIAAFTRTRKAHTSIAQDNDLQLLLDIQPDVITLMVKTWTLHVQKVLGTTLDENLLMVRDTVEHFINHGYQVIVDAEHFFDGYKANKDYAFQVIQTAIDTGASDVILCDTRGVSNPIEIYNITEQVKQDIESPLGIHAHNDLGLAVANSLFSVLGGATHIQGTINGLGERCGNADLIEVIGNLECSLKIKTGIDLAKLTPLSQYIYEIANIPGNKYKPFVGKFAFTHKGGIHGHAVRKLPQAYEGIDPTIFGNKRDITVSAQAGISNVLSKAHEFGYTLDKKSPHTKRILMQIKEMESKGYNFENANASLHLLYAKELGEKLDYFDLKNWRAYVLCDDSNVSAESTVKIKLSERNLITAGEGNGPVNAFDKALRKALRSQYPELSQVKLTGYRVRELDVEEGTAAAVRVFTEFKADNLRWSTIGLSPNILKASEEALTDGYRYYLYVKTKKEKV